MNAASLPYSLLLLLAETAVGSIAFATAFDARGQVTSGYVKAAGLTVIPLAAFALWIALAVDVSDDVGGYPLREAWFAPTRQLLFVFVLITVAQTVAALMERRTARLALGALAAAEGLLALVALAALVGEPAFSSGAVIVSVIASAAVLGSALMAMMWGHWYLTSGRLPREPMEQMALVLLAALVAQAMLVLLGSALPAREVPLTEGFGVGLAQNPAYWLRIGVGLVFPAGLAVLAWRAATIHGMMSATGLLYIALGAVLAGEGLARGLLFSTGLAV